jgi:glycosyltransferase involved in cell wall biosynthesis
MKTLRILGTRGVPAAHGGFETFAERLSLFLVSRGWKVTVYCQQDGSGPLSADVWQGVERIHIPVRGNSPATSVKFDWLATRHAARHPGLCLTLGYNTAVFCGLLRLAGLRNVINMDGIEWQRAKWGAGPKLWFWLNEHAGSRLGDHLVADHPGIADHLARAMRRDKISTIAYGADRLENIDPGPVHALGIVPQRYYTLVARPEPENSVLEVVQAFSRHARGQRLVVLGRYVDENEYHRAVRAAAGPEVQFVGAIYDPATVRALRYHCTAYIHGHQVGGTNPSLVEALGAGNAVIAHDNKFNRWVAGPGARYFASVDAMAQVLDHFLDDPQQLQAMRRASLARFEEAFTWQAILTQYEQLLTAWA